MVKSLRDDYSIYVIEVYIIEGYFTNFPYNRSSDLNELVRREIRESKFDRMLAGNLIQINKMQINGILP